jgi:tripartite-type tricarboxylate transporter receptor subunit TctC
MAAELFKVMADVNIVHVPYRGEALALTDLIGGQVQVLFAVATGSIEYIRAGRLRALAVTSARRLGMLSDIPTIGEFIAGYEASQWYGIGAPKSTPDEIVDKLNTAINAALNDPKVKARLENLVSMPMPMTPTEAVKFTAAETNKWAELVKFVGLKSN